jgi:hypothetical protein
MVTVTPESDDSGVLVQSERNLGFEGQPITFDNNFGQRFSSHRAQQIFILFREPFRKN